MAEILGELAARALDGYDTGLDVDFDCARKCWLALEAGMVSECECPFPRSLRTGAGLGVIRTTLRDQELLLGMDVQHLGRMWSGVVAESSIVVEP